MSAENKTIEIEPDINTDARLQLQDVISPRYRTLFSPLDINDLHAPAGPGATWLHYRLPPTDAPRQLRLFGAYCLGQLIAVHQRH